MRGLADAIAGDEAEAARRRFLARLGEDASKSAQEAAELAALLECAYPALARWIAARPKDVVAIARGTKLARDARTYRRIALPLVGDLGDHEGVRRGLRVFAAREKLRIAARELLAHAGSDVDVTARELSDLADVCCEIALAEAITWATARFGAARTSAGDPCGFVVVGMGKLGGRELNAGSDIDLLLFYETDDGAVEKDGAATDVSLHEYFTRVAQRFVSTIEEVTEDGAVWRVDLRLRPEGSKGPIVNALASAERYYETWGRTWERAALVRARAVAGDAEFGKRLLEALAPFVWRRAVDPRVAGEMAQLLVRARVEAHGEVDRDLKIGPGGIREVEFFAQSLQLIWGGRQPAVRSTNTLDALRRLRAHGYITDREGREMADAYLVLRRLEHRIQFATGIQTHALPDDASLLDRIARSLGFGAASALLADLERTRTRVAARFHSLTGRPESRAIFVIERLYAALDARDEGQVAAFCAERFGEKAAGGDLARHLLALAKRPDMPLGAKTRDAHPDLARILIDALADTADPEQATRLLAAFFARFVTPSIYARALADDPRAATRLASLFGASAFLGESLVAHPELLDRLLFGRGTPTPATARAAVLEELSSGTRDPDQFVGALRRAKAAVTMEVGLADLAGELGTRDCTLALSELADATLDQACGFAMYERGARSTKGLAIVAMGKLGGREIGYGSDLDIFFVYDAGENEDHEQAERFIRVAQRVLRLASVLHDDGPGYELDTRLRPSGNQGLLVVSIDAFERYNEKKAEPWERQALVKARFCAGDAELGARVMRIAERAAYEHDAPPVDRLHHLRIRMQNELTRERLDKSPARYDLKLGRGALVDVEFATQWLQMKHGGDPRVRTQDTERAIAALETCGYLDASLAGPLAEGYRFLRRLEQRLRVLHGTSAQLLEEGAPGLALLARRMGMRDGPRASATDALLARYAEVTREVRAAYLAVLGVSE
jgi:glutamate-ammonia-ligase adenylyltransferase